MEEEIRKIVEKYGYEHLIEAIKKAREEPAPPSLNYGSPIHIKAILTQFKDGKFTVSEAAEHLRSTFKSVKDQKKYYTRDMLGWNMDLFVKEGKKYRLSLVAQQIAEMLDSSTKNLNSVEKLIFEALALNDPETLLVYTGLIMELNKKEQLISYLYEKAPKSVGSKEQSDYYVSTLLPILKKLDLVTSRRDTEDRRRKIYTPRVLEIHA